MPLAQRQGGFASFVLYALLGLVVVAVINAHLVIDERGAWPLPPIVPVTSAVVLLGAVLGGLLPRRRSPFALSTS